MQEDEEQVPVDILDSRRRADTKWLRGHQDGCIHGQKAIQCGNVTYFIILDGYNFVTNYSINIHRTTISSEPVTKPGNF